jgi:hypothetical protein
MCPFERLKCSTRDIRQLNTMRGTNSECRDVLKNETHILNGAKRKIVIWVWVCLVQP